MATTSNIKTPDTNTKGASAKRLTKKAQLIKLLSGTAGSDIETISAKLGWLPHTSRAALTGLRKAAYYISGTKPPKGGPLRYRIAGEPASAQTASNEAATNGS